MKIFAQFFQPHILREQGGYPRVVLQSIFAVCLSCVEGIAASITPSRRARKRAASRCGERVILRVTCCYQTCMFVVPFSLLSVDARLSCNSVLSIYAFSFAPTLFSMGRCAGVVRPLSTPSVLSLPGLDMAVPGQVTDTRFAWRGRQ